MKIVLFCGGGMSSSILSQRMEEEIKKRGINATISAHAVVNVEKYAKDADVIMVAPQIRFEIPKVREKVHPIPVEMIRMEDYGMMRADRVLKHALTLIKESRENA